MPFKRPTLQELITRTGTDLNTRLTGGKGAPLRRSVLGVLARAFSGAVHLLYGYLSWVARQVMPDTAEQAHLDRWASIWGVNRKAAAFASGNVTFTGVNSTVIPAGTEVQTSDGATYTTDSQGTISTGTATISVTASESGVDGNVDAGVGMTLTSPISGVDTDATVASGGITGGLDEEADDDLRDRLLSRIQQPPHGGADFDYVTWAKEIAGVTRAWVYPRELGAGTVSIRFVTDDESSIIPTSSKVTEVQNHIDSKRPVTADATVVAPIAAPVSFTISVTPDTADVRAAVEAELKDMITRGAEPGKTILFSHIREAISVAAGESDHSISSPTADVTHSAGEIATFGGITWQ